MTTRIILALIAASLTGCVIAPYERRPAQVTFEAGVVYPVREMEYFWEPSLHLHYFWVYRNARSERQYMPHGWDYREHGVPRHR
jgi:hypothetical protein